MAASKPDAGILSTGQCYLVCTTTAHTGGARAPLSIVVGGPGEALLGKVFLVRRSVFAEGPGVSAPNADFGCSHAVEHEGHLNLLYDQKSHMANAVAVVPVASLETGP